MTAEVICVCAGNSGVRIMHHQDLSKKILIALIAASTLLGVLLLFFSCFWIYRSKKVKNSNGKTKQNFGILLFHEIAFAFVLVLVV